MMPVIRISDSTAKKLQKLAIPLVDNYDTVIGRLVDTALSGAPYRMPADEGMTEVEAAAPAQEEMDKDEPASGAASLAIEDHEDFTHTRLRKATFGDVPIDRPNWNSLLKHAHIAAYQKLGSFEALRLASRAHIRQGKYEDDGFTYLEGINVSLQGLHSNGSWENSLRLAQAIGTSIEISYEWYNNPKAARPGQSGTLSWFPQESK